MKKALSLLLSLVLALSCCAAVAYAAEPAADLAFAVTSDLHINLPDETLEKTNDDPLFWYANRRASMDNESGYILDAFLSQCAADDSVDFVLISGDLADHGKTIPAEHALAAEKLAAFEEASGKEVYVINGNHDCGNNSSTGMAEFKEIYARFGYDHALATRETDCSYTANLGEKYRLIALDSTDFDRSTGDGLTAEKMDWVKEQAAGAKADGRYPILMMHHNLLDHMPLQPVFSKDFIVRNHLLNAEKFADWGIKLVFTGHEHCSDATSYTSAAGNVITDFATTALSMYPLSYRIFSLSEETVTYQSETVKAIDTASLCARVSGYTPEMLQAMNTDLNAFAKGFLKAGIQYRLQLSLSKEKLGIAEDAVYYDLVMKVVGKLTDILAMPLYGEGSVQELARQYNIDIPDSSYLTGWDLATELVSSHYAGSENRTLEGTDITILLRTVSLILKEELSLVSDELYLSAAASILAGFGIPEAADSLEKLGESVFGGVTPGEYLLLAIASPLLYGFANDDAVDDNNGTLAGYGTVSLENNLSNISLNLTAVFNKIVLYLNLVFRVLARASGTA